MSIVIHITPKDQINRCQYIYPPRFPNDKMRCKHDASYRIGQTIYLCGYHTPGVGRYANNRSIPTKELETE